MIIYHQMKKLLAHERGKGNKFIVSDGFLERGCGVMLVGAPGVGKSKAMQSWAGALATGSSFIGIKSNDEFKVLYLQAEDTEDDLAESYQGYVAHELNHDAAAVDTLDNNLTMVTLVGESGGTFLKTVDELCKKHAPDVLVIDPILAFLGCDLVDQKGVTDFLRHGLKPILMKHNCGCIAVHHSRKDKGGPAIDQAIGAMEFGAFFRGMINLNVKEDRHREITVKVSKRQRQLGWTDEFGNPADTKCVLKGADSINFTVVSGFEPGATAVAGGRPPKVDKKEVAAFIQTARATETDEKKLVVMVAEKFGYGAKQATRLVRAEAPAC